MDRIARLAGAGLVLTFLSAAASGAHFAGPLPPPTPPVITGALPYVAIPGAVAAPDPKRVYRMAFNVEHGATDPHKPAEGVLMAASLASNLRGEGVPVDHIHVAIVVHDKGLSSILSDAAYRARFGIANPNLPLLRGLKANGGRVLVCGQYLVDLKLPPDSLADGVEVGSDAYIVLTTLQNDGFGILAF
jgi:intracellular sulfur oxidation DsrE/DsrF family protein